MSTIFEAVCAHKTPNVAGILLNALRDSKQDVLSLVSLFLIAS